MMHQKELKKYHLVLEKAEPNIENHIESNDRLNKKKTFFKNRCKNSNEIAFNC